MTAKEIPLTAVGICKAFIELMGQKAVIEIKSIKDIEILFNQCGFHFKCCM